MGDWLRSSPTTTFQLDQYLRGRSIVQNDQDVPFDLGHIRHVRYMPNKEGLEELREDLLTAIRATRA